MSETERIRTLEDRVGFLEHELDQLNTVVRNLHDKIDALTEAFKLMKDEAERQRFLSEGRTIEDEKPPHWGP